MFNFQKCQIMNNYKPYGYLYKRESAPKILKACFVANIPEGKKITLVSGDPNTDRDKTFIRFDVENDPNQNESRQVENEYEISWDGQYHEVEIVIGDGESTGGKLVQTTAVAEEL